ncbi:MAG: hypothetical protein HC913_01440 [Microscillaceae bacterium]|nr:hypothetical protein [Microscillaceae bacterium]
MNTEIKILTLLQKLTTMQKLRLVDFLEAMLGRASAPKKPQNLLKFAGSIPSSDIQLMQKSIDEDCKKIDEDEW